MKRFGQTVTAILRSHKFFAGVLVFFFVESLWIAFSARYPEAFDEQFHLGIIQIYAHHWLPFLSSQPPNADQFGAVARDPSYLYHYLMSFPYRLVALVVHGQAGRVIALRLIDVALFGFGLVLFHRVMLRAKISPALANLSILIFTLIPIVPQLAGQINYDDLLFPLVAWACLLVFEVSDALISRRVNVRSFLTLLIVCLLASLVKYSFLPVFFAAMLFMLLIAVRTYRKKADSFWAGCRAGWVALSKRSRVVLVLLVVVSAGLFFQRYGINTIRYGTPIPNCSKVLSIQECNNYGPWARDYNDSLQSHSGVSKDPVIYTGEWLYGLYFRLFFAINGNYVNYYPLPLPSIAAILLAVTGAIAVIVWWRPMFTGNRFLVFFLLMSASYCGALWLDNYKDFLYTGQPVAVNGRYLLPVLLPMAAIIGRAMSLTLQHRHRIIKPVLATAVILLFIQGGGVLTFISRSDTSWYWQSPAVVHVNQTVHHVLSPILIEKGGKYY